MKVFKELFRTARRRANLRRLSPETEIHWRSYTEDPPEVGCYIGMGSDGKSGGLVQGYRTCTFTNRFRNKPEFWAEIPVVGREFHLRNKIRSEIRSYLVWKTERRPRDVDINHLILFREDSGARVVLWPGSEPFDEDAIVAWAECPSR